MEPMYIYIYIYKYIITYNIYIYIYIYGAAVEDRLVGLHVDDPVPGRGEQLLVLVCDSISTSINIRDSINSININISVEPTPCRHMPSVMYNSD